MLRDWEHVSESFLDKIDVLFVVSNATSDDKALSGGDVIHDELLKHSLINVVDILPLSELSEEDQLRFDQFFDDLETQIRKKFLESTLPITWKVLQAAVDAEIHRENEAA